MAKLAIVFPIGSLIGYDVTYVSQMSVLRKMAWAFSKAFARDVGSARSPRTISVPRDASDLEASEDGLRVNARTCQCGNFKKVLATELPCLPVAPTTTMIFFAVATAIVFVGGSIGRLN